MKIKKILLSLLLITALILPGILLPNITYVLAEEWEQCVYCGHNRSADWLCDCGGCNEESYDCYSEHHCYDCGACEMDISMCDDCKRCVYCVGIMCMDCGQCEECAGRICDDCQKCSDHWTLDLYCEGCDKCCDCFGLGYCYECELCGDCTNLCSNDDCSLCETCTGQVCTECGQCGLCAYGLFCEDCGSCGECSGLMHCNLCDDCVTVCKGCENGCSNCRDICMTCEECEDCVETLCPECNECIGCSGATICIGCDLCSNCVNMCEDCGEVCSDCEDFCQECNICTNCLPEELCNGCGDYCLGCKEYCTECSCCEECANLCDDCEEMCDGCADFCLDCNKCANCVDLCENCQEYCSDCMETCGNCGWCSECTHICQDCGKVCENCGTLCSDCREYCCDCRHLCEGCGACSECANLCSECGEVCDDCASFCIRCDQCENCVNLCSACEQVCDNCEPFCQGCNTGACCAYICPNCGESCTECQSDWTYKSLDNIQHQWQCSCGAPLEEPESHCFIYEVRKAATATEAGFGELKCDLCNYKERVAIPATGSEEHSHNFSFWVSELSSHEMYCACGANDPLTKGAHEFQWVTDIEATIGDPGLKHQECTVCGYQLPGETIPRIDHTHAYETTWSSDYTGHWHACSCGHKSDEASHAMGEWIVTSAPTETKPGSKERVCNICNYKQTLVIPSMATNLTVTFDGNGGSSVPAQSVVNGGKAVKPENPSRPGYVFTGWYTTASGTTAYNFYQSIYEPITLYAQWELDISEPPKILTDNLRQCYKGVSYNEILEASGSAPITWSIIDGKLPNGLTLNRNTGEISGKSTEDGLFTIVIIAENKYDADIKSYTLTSSIRSSGGGGGGVTTTTYTITTNAGIGGSIDSDTTVSVKAGENIKFNIKPNQGYAVEDVKVDGKSVGAVSDYEFTKVNENHTISATFKKIEDSKPEIDKSYDFTDVSESQWYYESVMMACNKGWFSGTSDTTFSPDTAMNRGMIVTVLWRIEGRPAAQAKSFNDVAADKYYSTAVAWAAEHGIVSGYGNDVFGPDDSITREQMAVMLYNYAKYKGYDLSASGDLSKFVDRNKTTEYAVNAIKWAVGSGIINGKGGSILDPTGNSTRAEVATMLMKFLPR